MNNKIWIKIASQYHDDGSALNMLIGTLAMPATLRNCGPIKRFLTHMKGACAGPPSVMDFWNSSLEHPKNILMG